MKRSRLNYIYLYSAITLLLHLSSCASNRLHVDTENHISPSIPDTSKIIHSFYLIGDAGGAEEGGSTLPLLEIRKSLSQDGRLDNSTDVIFLGDNIYPVGMPPKGHQDRSLAEHRLNVQLESVRGFKGNITFIPGNHDWYEFGRAGLLRQEQYIENYLSQYNEDFTDYFRPSNGCGDIALMHVSPKIVLVSIDSDWFLTGKEDEYDFSDCEIRTREQFLEIFQDTLKSLKDKKVVLSMHHPLFTTGKHGGYYDLKSIVFPASQWKKHLWIPTPLIGGVLSFIKPKISPQDNESLPFVTLKQAIIPIIEQHGNTIVVAGHEHALQHHLVNEVSYIVSGSASKKEAVSQENYTKFAYGNFGYGLLDYYSDGSVYLHFYSVSENDNSFKEVYRSKLK